MGYETQFVFWEFFGNPDCGSCSAVTGFYAEYPEDPYENCRCSRGMILDVCELAIRRNIEY